VTSAGGQVTGAGLGPERTTLAWWRTSQLAIGTALIFVKFSAGHSAIGWVAAGLATALAVVALLVARSRSGSGEATAQPSPTALIAVTVVSVALAASVLGLVIAAL
jgi:hypothetical protein